MLLLNSISLINLMFMLICKYKYPTKTLRFAFPYFLIHVVCTVLFYHGYLGEWENKNAYTHQIVVMFVLVNSIQLNDLGWTVFLQVPTFLIGIYFQSLAECRIEEINLEILLN